MKLVSALLIWAAATPVVSPELRYFHYERPIGQLAAAGGQTCVALEPLIFAHAAPGLADLRLYQGTTETPYVIRSSEPAGDNNVPIPVLNLGQHGSQTAFDAPMPTGTYSDVALSITGHDFLAAVTVSGKQAETGTPETKLGAYTIFDLTRQRLGRSTVLHLPISDFRFLHFQIEGPIRPKDVTGLTVLRVAASEPKYVTASSTSLSTQKGHQTVIDLTVHEDTPVDRIVFKAGATPANFSRDLQIRVTPAVPAKNSSDEAAPPVQASGNLLRVHRVEDGHAINEEHLAVNAPRGMANDQATRWTITIDNGDDAPVALESVQTQMLERDLCFDAAAGAAYTLHYGDEALSAPRYDYASLFKPQQDAVQARAGPEAANPDFEPRPDARPFTERHPILLWVVLGLVIALLGTITLRTAKSPATRGRS